jgi:hypothetical protein
MPPHGWITIVSQSNAYKNIDFCPTTPMHVVFGLKLEKVVNKLSFEQNVKNHHKFWLLQNYINNIHWKFTQKIISWIRLARKSLDPIIQLCKHSKPYIIIQEWNINYFVSFNKLMKKIFQCFDLISQSNCRDPSFERMWRWRLTL